MVAFIRLSTWKGKLSAFLCVMYTFFYKNPSIPFEKEIKLTLFLLIGLSLGAIWASLINNFYDIEADRIAKKPNGMIVLSPLIRKLSLTAILLSGIIFSYYLYPNKLAFSFYCLGWLFFYLYSSSLFRLKEKPYFDLVCDGLASQFFPILFIFSYLFNGNFKGNVIFILSASIWIFLAMGVRALIIHQYRDKEQDLRAGLNTYVIGSTIENRGFFENSLVIFESLFFVFFSISVDWMAFSLSVILYSCIVFLYFQTPGMKMTFFNRNVVNVHRILFYDWYTIFAFIILGFLVLEKTNNGLFLVFHLLIFHKNFISNFILKIKKILF